MCGRYSLFAEDNQEIRKIIEQVNLKHSGVPIKTGEIYPTNFVPVLLKGKESVSPCAVSWGFPNFRSKGVIINARSETAAEKKTFRDALLNRRCAVPTTGFYEWDKNKQKYIFTIPEEPILYLAGIYSFYKEEPRFVILTTSANESMHEIHNRMPVILKQEALTSWIESYESASAMLNTSMPQLNHKRVG